MTGRRYFFAYPSAPSTCVEAMTTAARLLSDAGNVASTWQDLHPTGRILINTITDEIDKSDTVVAEISSMNRNVLFEAGYALARNKSVYLALDESLTSATRLWEGVGLLSTTGRLNYHGNGIKLASLIRQEDITPDQSLLETLIAESKPPQHNAIFAPSVPVRFQAADMLDKELSNRGDIQVLASGDDLGLAPLSYYAGEIFRSAGAIFHFMNPDRTRATEHNARASFLAGFAYGWDRPILMLAETEFDSPLDYRDMLFNYYTAAQMVKQVKSWIASIPMKPGSDRRTGRLTMNLSLPVTSFGQYVAENEDNRLDSYFIQTTEFSSLLNGEASVFVGRKGTGKTATMLQAATDLGNDRRNMVVKVKPTAYELSGLIELVSRFQLHAGAEYLMTNLWNFLLSTEVAVQLLAKADDQLAGIGGSKRLVELTQRLNLMKVDPKSDLATRLEDTVEKIIVESHGAKDDRELREIVAGALGVHWFRDFHRELQSALSDYQRVAILVDNLDKAWERGANFECISRFLLALLSASGQVRKALTRGTSDLNLTLGVFLRTDIYEVMKRYAREPDKIGPLSVQWHDPDLLVRVLEERYEANKRRRKSGDDMWSAIFPAEVDGLPTKNYILWRILPRPRDMIYFGNAALTTAINRRHSIITQDDIAMADESYSRFAFEALVVESDAQGFDLEEVLFSFAGLGATIMDADVDEAVAGIAQPEEVLPWLMRTSFLGLETREGKFIHVEGQDEVDKKVRVAQRLRERLSIPTRYRVHPAFRHYLDIRDDDLHTPGYEDITLGG
ncbi:hypothetical protein Chelonae_p3238 [[Mycobacterium] chelonae subsp. bovistauri]|nr:hypothetical protein Chelonae_p3238 [Mycobacterium sp. QIA-37]